MLQIDPNITTKTEKLGKSIRTLGIMGLVVPFIRFFFRFFISVYITTYYSQENIVTYIQGFIVQYRAYYISDLLFFAIQAVFVGLFISHLFRFASLSIPNLCSFKSSAILFIIALIGNGLLSIFYGVFIESTYRQLLIAMIYGDIEGTIIRLRLIEFIIIVLYCFPSLLYLIGYGIFKQSSGVFNQFFPNPAYPPRIPYIVVIIGAAIAFIADLIQIPGYFDTNLTLIATLVSFVAYLTLNIGLIIIGSRIIGLPRIFQGYPSSMVSMPSSQQPSQTSSQPYLSYSFPSNPTAPPTISFSTVMPPVNLVNTALPPNILFCSRCGKPIPADSAFCMHCGNPLPKTR